jgi:hypothetical protein
MCQFRAEWCITYALQSIRKTSECISLSLYNIAIQNYWGFLTLSIIRYSRNWKTQHFGNYICFRPHVRAEDTYSVGCLGKSYARSLDNPCWVESFMLRPAVSRPMCFAIKHSSGAYDQIFITVWQLRVCWCSALSQTRGRVCRLQLLLVFASAVILGSESRGTCDHNLLSQIRDFHLCRLLRITELRQIFDSASTLDGQLLSESHSYLMTWDKANLAGGNKKILNKFVIEHVHSWN